MNQLTTLGEVRQQVETMNRNYHDELIPKEQIAFRGLKTVVINNEEHPMKAIAQRSMAKRLGIPFQYLQKCDPPLQSMNLYHWMEKERNENLFFRFDGEQVRAIFTPRYTPIDNIQVLDRLHENGYSDDAEVQCQLDDEFMSLNIIDKHREFKLSSNDRMKEGISIANSEVGLSSLVLSAFMLRLVCTNGLISQSSVDSCYRHVSQRIIDEFPEAIRNVSRELNRQHHQWSISMSSPVDHPESTLNTFNRQFNLDKSEQEAVDWAWPQEAGDRMFHIVNTYTKAAQYDSLRAEQSFHLQRTGGSILAMLN